MTPLMEALEREERPADPTFELGFPIEKLDRVGDRKAGAVGALRGQGVERVGNREDARFPRDRFAGEPSG